jgi:hypothetical protein
MKHKILILSFVKDHKHYNFYEDHCVLGCDAVWIDIYTDAWEKHAVAIFRADNGGNTCLRCINTVKSAASYSRWQNLHSHTVSQNLKSHSTQLTVVAIEPTRKHCCCAIYWLCVSVPAKCRGRVISTSRPGGQVPWLRLFVVFLSSFK